VYLHYPAGHYSALSSLITPKSAFTVWGSLPLTTNLYLYFIYYHRVPSSRHLRALLSVCGGCSFGGLGCCSCRVCVGGGVLCQCVCVWSVGHFTLTRVCVLPRRPLPGAQCSDHAQVGLHRVGLQGSAPLPAIPLPVAEESHRANGVRGLQTKGRRPRLEDVC